MLFTHPNHKHKRSPASTVMKPGFGMVNYFSNPIPAVAVVQLSYFCVLFGRVSSITLNQARTTRFLLYITLNLEHHLSAAI